MVVLPGDVDQLPLDAAPNMTKRKLLSTLPRNKWSAWNWFAIDYSTCPTKSYAFRGVKSWICHTVNAECSSLIGYTLIRQLIRQDMRGTEKEYQDKIVEYKELKGQALAALCRTTDIIGMTTAGAAKNQLMLESLKPITGNWNFLQFTTKHDSHYSPFICSDRGRRGGRSGPRPRDACWICSLTYNCQQLFVIVDHQQLRSPVNMHHLAKEPFCPMLDSVTKELPYGHIQHFLPSECFI